MDYFLEEWEKLNEMQQKAVHAIDGYYMILAPAGTGKTKVIAMRTAHMTRKGIAPERILNLTFTNKAAKEMEERIALYHTPDIKGFTIKTFHSFCYYLINQEKASSHFTFPCTIIDESDTEDLLKRIVRMLKKEDNPNIYGLSSFIENVKKHALQFPQEERHYYGMIVSHYIKEKGIRESLFVKYGTKILERYQKYLRDSNCVDFIDLIVEATYLLEDPAILAKWQNKFRYIQVDEMQDTSSREYALIKKLGQNNHLALFGDFNQTIYEWRGSDPLTMTGDFKQTFHPTIIELTNNYRSTQSLLKASNSLIRNTNLYQLEAIPQVLEIGEPIQVVGVSGETNELAYVAKKVKETLEEGPKKIAVLTRTNKQAKSMYEVFEQAGIPAIRVEDIRLFRKKEAKDIQAFFTYAMNKRNSHSLEKILKHPFIKLEEWLLFELKKTQKDYLYLHDWFNVESSDPYDPLVEAYNKNQLIILDVESTGLDTTHEDVIQIAAIRYGVAGVAEKLDVLLKPTKSVGDSFHIHGFSDDVLEREGMEPTLALAKLKAFAKNGVIVGHNIKYDLDILRSMFSRYNLDMLDHQIVYDTLDLARKVHPDLENHKLDTLSKLAKTTHEPNHNAYFDILATAEILTYLMHPIQEKKSNRLSHIEAYYPHIEHDKIKIQSITSALLEQTTFEGIQYLMNECDLKSYYNKEALETIREYYKVAKALYDVDLSMEDNIIKLLTFSALHHSEIEQTELFKNKIPIMTIHQAKGLEFDDVYMIRCNEGQFPSKRSREENKLTEELRLFYVGMTRAKERLYITYNSKLPESSFIKYMGEDFKSSSQIEK